MEPIKFHITFTSKICKASCIESIVGNKRFLEIGTGTGIVALFIALNGAEVIELLEKHNAKRVIMHCFSGKKYCGKK